MDIGTAIVVGAVWAFAGMAWLSSTVSGWGCWVALGTAVAVTVALV